MTDPNLNQTISGCASAEEFCRVPARTPVPVWLLAVLLGLITLALYWPATRCEFVNYDDIDYVTGNPPVRTGLTWGNVGWAFTTGHAYNWHPMTWLSLMLDTNLFGKKATGFHFTNLVLHAANVVLLFLLLQRLTGAVWRSALVAGLFGWHPVHVESVVWISERKDVLSTFFGFLALLFYGAYARESEARSQKSGAGGAAFYLFPTYWLAGLFFALGLMSKPMLVTWPFVMLLLDYWPLPRWQTGSARPLVVEKVPFFILAVAASMVTYFAQEHGGAVISVDDLPLRLRAGNAVIAYCRYLGKLFWPANLAILYPHPGIWPVAEVVLAVVFLMGVSVLLVWRRRRHPFFLMGWLWFLGTLVPVIGLVQVGRQAMADRYTYIPSVGILIMVVWAGCELARTRRRQVMLFSVAGPAAMLICLPLTRRQIECWQNSETLFQHAIEVTGNNYGAHDNLGVSYASSGRTDAAISQFEEALQIRPDYTEARYNLGLALSLQGKTDAAIWQFQEVVRLDPNYARAHEKLGNLLAGKGRKDDALSQFREAIRLKPQEASFHDNLGNLLVMAGQSDAAIGELQEAIRLQPEDATVHDNLGNLLARKGQTEAALSQFKEAVRLNPAYAKAHDNLGIVLVQVGRTNAAIDEFQAALRLNPDFVKAHDHLGFVLASQGRREDAIHHYQVALKLKPDDADARSNLTQALARTNNSTVRASSPAKP